MIPARLSKNYNDPGSPIGDNKFEMPRHPSSRSTADLLSVLKSGARKESVQSDASSKIDCIGIKVIGHNEEGIQTPLDIIDQEQTAILHPKQTDRIINATVSKMKTRLSYGSLNDPKTQNELFDFQRTLLSS